MSRQQMFADLQCGHPRSDKHNDCAHSFEEWEYINKAQPIHRKLPRIASLKFHHWVKNLYEKFIGSRIGQGKRRVRLLLHGYDPQEWWMHHYAVSRIAVKHLERMRDDGHGIKPTNNSHVQGVSFDGEGREEWATMLDDMVFFHKVASHQLPERPKTYTSPFGRDRGEKVTFMHSPEFEDLDKDEQARYRRGKFYYFKYFEQLWD